jgi:hypothetical protein
MSQCDENLVKGLRGQGTISKTKLFVHIKKFQKQSKSYIKDRQSLVVTM